MVTTLENVENPKLGLDDDSALIAAIKSEGIRDPQRCLDVCDLMVTGLSLRQATKKLGTDSGTFCRMVARSQTLNQHYTRAREIMLDVRVDEMLDVDQSDVTKFPRLEDGRIDPASVQIHKMRSERLQWAASKLNPKRYGDKLELYGDADNPITVQRIERVVVDHALPDKSEQNDDAIDV